jgi:hypothetical protein
MDTVVAMAIAEVRSAGSILQLGTDTLAAADSTAEALVASTVVVAADSTAVVAVDSTAVVVAAGANRRRMTSVKNAHLEPGVSVPFLPEKKHLRRVAGKADHSNVFAYLGFLYLGHVRERSAPFLPRRLHNAVCQGFGFAARGLACSRSVFSRAGCGRDRRGWLWIWTAGCVWTAGLYVWLL